MGWRAAFGIGGGLSAIILIIRYSIAESLRWLMTHGRIEEANTIVDGIEAKFESEGYVLDDRPIKPVRLKTRSHTPLIEVATSILKTNRDRAIVGFALIAAQAYFYNAIFFTYALSLGLLGVCQIRSAVFASFCSRKFPRAATPWAPV